MVRRASYQKGHIFKRGKKGQQVWVARWRERVLQTDNSLGHVHKSVVLGLVSRIGSKSKAESLLESRLRSINQGRQHPQSTMSFEQFVGTVWKPSELLIGEHTHRLYDSLLRTHLFPVFGQDRLCDIQRVDLALFFGEITAKLQTRGQPLVHDWDIARSSLRCPFSYILIEYPASGWAELRNGNRE